MKRAEFVLPVSLVMLCALPLCDLYIMIVRVNVVLNRAVVVDSD